MQLISIIIFDGPGGNLEHLQSLLRIPFPLSCSPRLQRFVQSATSGAVSRSVRRVRLLKNWKLILRYFVIQLCIVWAGRAAAGNGQAAARCLADQGPGRQHHLQRRHAAQPPTSQSDCQRCFCVPPCKCTLYSVSSFQCVADGKARIKTNRAAAGVRWEVVGVIAPSCGSARVTEGVGCTGG